MVILTPKISYGRCRPWSRGVITLNFGLFRRCSGWFVIGSNRDSRDSLVQRRPTMSLEPIEPEAALELFLKDKEAELAQTTIKSHDYRLRHFLRWCHEQGIENLNTLTGRQLHEYRLWRREDGDLNKVSEKTQMDSL